MRPVPRNREVLGLVRSIQRLAALSIGLAILGCGGAGKRFDGPTPAVVLSDGPIPLAYTGIYSLQGLLDFDVLEGAAVDEATGVVALFGRRASPDRFVSVAYLDHLATAMDCENPTFSLETVPGSQHAVDRALEMDAGAMTGRLARLFDGAGRLTPLGAWWLRLGGCRVQPGMTKYKANAAILAAGGRPQAGRALDLMEQIENKSRRGQDTQEEMEDLGRAVGVYDEILVEARRFRAGKITEHELHDRAFPLLIGGIASAFGEDPDAYTSLYRSRRRKGAAPDGAFDSALDLFWAPETQKRFMGRAMDRMWRDVKNIQIPPAEAAIVLGAAPRVRPVFSDLPPRSLLARVAYEADVLGKFLMDLPELKPRIPRYRTWFEWQQTVGHLGNMEGHLWFAPDGFEIREAPDGSSMRFGATPMRLHLERYVGGGRESSRHPALQEYADELTSLYDDFAREYPVLHELRECMKVMAVAKWLKGRGVSLRFPAEGRAYWNPPVEIPGIVHISIAKERADFGSVIRVLGGVDLRHPTLKFVKSPDPPLPTVRLLQEDNEALNRVLRRKMDVPSPVDYDANRELPGWHGRATQGRDTLDYLALRKDQLGSKADLPEVRAQIEKVEKAAKMLDQYDRLINGMRKERIESVQDLEKLKREAEDLRREFLQDIGDFFQSSSVTGWRQVADYSPVGTPDNLARKKLAGQLEDLGRIKESIDDVSAAIPRLLKDPSEDRTDEMAAWRTRATERLGQLGVASWDLSQHLKDAPRYMTEAVKTRVGWAVSTAATLGKLHVKAWTAHFMERVTQTVSDAMGDRAIQIDEVVKRRNQFAVEVGLERQKLDGMLAGKP